MTNHSLRREEKENATRKFHVLISRKLAYDKLSSLQITFGKRTVIDILHERFSEKLACDSRWKVERTTTIGLNWREDWSLDGGRIGAQGVAGEGDRVFMERRLTAS